MGSQSPFTWVHENTVDLEQGVCLVVVVVGGRAQILLSENLSSQIGIFSISTHLALVFIDVIEMISLI